ncbi:MAG TPA: OmpA family protein [Bacteroidales bacterium]|nr:OmpA family protein [Bacteroidales bacterium]
MKKTFYLFTVLFSISLYAMAGGIVTNTNQSAAFIRLGARNAAFGLDGVYYNPAGLTNLCNGLFLSLNNQTIFQTNTIKNSYPYLHGAPTAKYTGDVSAPVFPGFYAGYKFGKFALSFGFNPIGGGGGAKYDEGVPEFEIPISNLVPMLNSDFGVTDYKADISFEGTSVYFGYQGGLSYEVSPVVSLYVGLRYVTVKNTYKGSIRNIMVNPGGVQFVRAQDWGMEMSDYYTGIASNYTMASAGAQQLTTAGLGGYTYEQIASLGFITAEQQAGFEQALQGAGQPVDTPIGDSQAIFDATATKATAGAGQMDGLAAQTGDKEVDAEQTGSGITPIIAANLTLAKKLTLSLRYEFLTKIDVTNDTKTDDTGMFPDGEKSSSDLPGMLAVGASYPLTNKFRAYADFNYYWDKQANYGKTNDLGQYINNESLIDHNMWELGAGLEYNISKKFLVSAGYIYSASDVMQDYQSNLSYSLTSNTVGFGGAWQITPKIGLNLGCMLVYYKDDEKDYSYTFTDEMTIPVTETYGKFTQVFAIGLDLTFCEPFRDKDKDGVPDKFDLCPNTPLGISVTEDGCPVDADKDGIPDYLDKCVTVAGIETFNGCPDTDGDGIQDSEDDCPSVKGTAAFRGCPDTDGDGIKDADDKCPTVKGIALFEGCPDTDGDGIADADDQCPNDKGPKELKGCPDTDGDGIVDIDDKCPTVAGIVENKGCPAVKEETQKVFDQALRGINFETAKDVIKVSSYPILDNVVNIMQENPEYNLEINGHTDSQGDDASNMDLSQRRANAVKKYLTDKGISATRMVAKGFGETLPVESNDTAAGRAQNRRVEFKVFF